MNSYMYASLHLDQTNAYGFCNHMHGMSKMLIRVHIESIFCKYLYGANIKLSKLQYTTPMHFTQPILSN